MRSRIIVIICCACLILFANKISQAGPPTQSAADFRRLESLTALVGDVSFRIDGPKLWTLSGIEFQKTVLAVQDSAYGSVINIKGVGYLGSAHFLDFPNKPGEVEKEQVTQVQWFLDDQPLTEITPQMSVTGKSFRMERKSKIRAVAVDSSVIVRDGILIESARMRTTEPVDLKVTYPLMYAWTPSATAYLFGDDKGVQKRGVFLRDDAKPGEGLEKSSRWMAVYDAPSGKGAVCYVVKQPSTAEARLQFTDAPKIYRKLRLMSFVETTMPAGFDGTFQTAIGFFNAREEDWEAKALERLTKLKSDAATPSIPAP